ncbi:MAG: ATP-binding protein, partial [Elusimicrobiota bacterium]
GRAVKVTGLYRSTHPIAAEAIKEVYDLADLALTTGGRDRLTLSFQEERWLCNDASILAASQAPENLQAFFKDHGLRSLSFLHGLRAFEMAAICELASAPAGRAEKGALDDFFAQKGIKHIKRDIEKYERTSGKAVSARPAEVPALPPEPQRAAPAATEVAFIPAGPGTAPVEAAGAPLAGPKGRLAGMSFGELLKVLVESSVNDPKERVHLYEDAVHLVKDAMDRHVTQATSSLVQEKERILCEQARTERVLSAVAEGKVIVDKDGRVLMMNPAAEALAGKSLSELAGKHITESVNTGEHMVALAKDIGMGPGARAEVELVANDEISSAMRRSLAVVQDAAGRVVGTYSGLPAAAKFRETQRMQEEFLSRVTHDLQAPLSSICCALELLSERAGAKLGPEETNFVDVCLRNSQQLGQMIRDILDFSKLQSGRMVLRRAPVSVAAMLQEAVGSMQPWAGNKGVSLSFRAPEPDLLAMADQRRVVQILTNLISNAIKFTASGGIIVAGAGLEVKKQSGIVFGVRDTGCGIAQESLQKVFDKFTQVDNPAGAKDGVGLGLSIVNEFVKLHGGAVWADSEVGKGSTFYFTLPLAERTSGVPS